VSRYRSVTGFQVLTSSGAVFAPAGVSFGMADLGPLFL
jgi:hypothetical protein